MRRALLLTAAIGGGAAFAAPAPAAPPPPQITDAKGDWVVAAEDVTSVRLSSVLVGGKPALRADLALAAAPEQEKPADYVVSFGVGCVTYAFRYLHDNPAAAPTVTLRRTDCNSASTTHDYAATFSVKGTTATWVAPYAGGIKRGVVASSFGVAAYSVLGLSTYTHPQVAPETYTGDVAYSKPGTTYVVGSDLPRR